MFALGCHQFDLKTDLLKDDSVLNCISRTHSLHEQISGSIVRMNMFCILWMLCYFACQLPGSDNVPFVCCWATAFSLHFKGGFCGLFLNVIGRQALNSFSFTLFIPAQPHSLSPFKWPFECVLFRKVHMKLCWIWFHCQKSVIKIKNKTFSLLSLSFNQLLKAHIFLKYLVFTRNPEWIFPQA